MILRRLFDSWKIIGSARKRTIPPARRRRCVGHGAFEALEQRSLLAADTLGSDFWLAFQQNFDSTNPALSLFITGPTGTTGTVALPGLGFSTNFSVTPGTVTTVNLPSAGYVGTNDGVENRGIHVTSGAEVAVYGLNRVPFTTDAFVGLPVDILGTEYIAMTHQSRGADSVASQVAVVAAENGTVITVTPSAATGARAAGVPYNVSLSVGQVYQLANTVAGFDLTGTVIASNKPVAVFSGNSGAQVPAGTAFVDHIVEQMPPVVTWGRNFVTVPLAQRTGGDTFRILASEDATEVRIDGALVATLNRGKFFETRRDTPLVITANKPVLVAQFAQGRTIDNTTGDPFMAIVPPIEQLLTAYTVTTPATGFDTHWINLWTPSQAASSVHVDGSPVSPALFIPIGSSGFVGANVPVSPGTHTISSSAPLGAMMYGFTLDDSYGYTGGASLVPIGDVASLAVAADPGSGYINQPRQITATVLDGMGMPIFGALVEFVVSGANQASGFAFTQFNGQATFSYTGDSAGIDTITATVGQVSGQGAATWTLAPNLIVQSLTTSVAGTWGDNVSVQWQVHNVGQGGTNASWVDRAYLSVDNTIDDGDVSLGSFPSTPLAAGGSYGSSVNFNLPDNLTPGSYHVLIAANPDGSQFESMGGDNVAAVPLTLVAPNLTVGPVDAPGTAVPGSSLPIGWTVTNAGTGMAASAFVDRVYISHDATLSADDLLLTTRSGQAPLPTGGSYVANANVVVPMSLSSAPGTYWVMVATDDGGAVRESDELDNLATSVPIDVGLPPAPNLVVSSIAAPSEATDGSQVHVFWTLSNDGMADATGTWVDEVSLSDDQAVGNDTGLGQFGFSGTIPAGQAVQRSAIVTLPAGATGLHWLVVQTDVTGQVDEQSHEDDNAMVDDQSIDVHGPLVANLVVTSVAAPPTATAGQQAQIDWIVGNSGTAATDAALWIDRVFLSNDATLDGGDTMLGEVARSGQLGAGASYDRSLAVTLPAGIAGGYFFFVTADATDQVPETNGEGDNVGMGGPTQIAPPPPADLAVSAVDGPASALVGHTVTVQWSVSNFGAGDTSTAQWTDEIYVSFNGGTLDPADFLLGSLQHTGALASGDGYNVMDFQVTLPAGQTGTAYFIVRSDANGQVDEAGSLQNNVLASTGPTNVTLVAHVAGRQIFYNNSIFDDRSAVADSADDGAVASDKSALMPGGTATFANYTSYSRGINGIMVDVAHLAGAPTAADFTLRVGNDNDPNLWPTAPPPLSVTVRPGAGANGSDRVTLIWQDSAIKRQWLQVSVLPTGNTGLERSDVFYFGNAVGEVGNLPTSAMVTSIDEALIRENWRSLFNVAPIDFAYDINRDGVVNVADQLLARVNFTKTLTALRLVTVPPGDNPTVDPLGEEAPQACLLASAAGDGLEGPAGKKRKV